MRHHGSNIQTTGPQPINRERVCPLLLRVFLKMNAFHSASEFKSRTSLPESDEIKLYTWRNATLKEISELIKEVNVPARHRDSKMTFAFVSPDSHGVYKLSAPLGCVHAIKKGDDDQKTLDSLNFNFQYLAVNVESNEPVVLQSDSNTTTSITDSTMIDDGDETTLSTTTTTTTTSTATTSSADVDVDTDSINS
ncbi:hypothetical protein SAMD00019534_066060 [Acytostelium subglobosum LB1]|uniref:hypothetical protein n=1 Tax=Acytostelium subglobosum LB1 TaxID=1410327 RepID=UPI000644B645|nr:hypothetical protein SAMD00019534_066060 [Acytostelium subglobosum LB1]GAM23431.1 hypothetical protein SAMD00019534_066060 [Acytostelium subglobosum LB1]|eukprot:XP_012753880.1 hypothetical protein SAMD00019534_066060 [Acytostelium subglobosum LB1]